MTPEIAHTCRIELLGPLRLITQGNIKTRFRLQKMATLLAYLALNLQRTHYREHLIDLLWPERDTEAGRDNLSTTLSALRHELEPSGVPRGAVLLADRLTVGLRPERIATDTADFDGLLIRARSAPDTAERARLLGHALALYRGDLLAECYEEWALTLQTAYRERYREALLTRAQDLETQQDWEGARIAAERALDEDSLSEGSALVLMRVLARQGLTARAVQTYHQLEQRLSAALDLAPAPELCDLLERLKQDPERPLYRVEPGQMQPVQAVVSVPEERIELETVGGAVPLDSPFYIMRPADALFQSAIQRRESIVLVKGPGQTGKTSLLARGLQQARRDGAVVVLTDLQKLSAPNWSDAHRFYLALAQNIADRLDLPTSPADVWSPARGANETFERFLQREVIARLDRPLVWGLDEVDRLFPTPFRNDVFALFRSWHNERVLDPEGPWRHLTLAISYATEAHLFITDLNQSPFNVGTRLTLEDFTLGEVGELNRRYHAPLDEGDLARFYELVGGNPYLVRRGLYEIVMRPLDLEAFERQADRDDGCYGAHLRRMAVTLTRDPELAAAVGEMVHNQAAPTSPSMSEESFHRLRSAGIVSGEGRDRVAFRCRLYASYLQRHLT